MKILGIESSCDETAAAVVEDGYKLLSNVVNSQIDIHALYGGVIPEVAARSHIEVILPVIDQALIDANCTWDDIDAIGVTYAPGLVGSLLIGSLAARTIAFLKQKPLYAVHHVEGHVYANFLTKVGGGMGHATSKTGEQHATRGTQNAKWKDKIAAKRVAVSGAGHVPRPHESASQAKLDGDIVLQTADWQSSPKNFFRSSEKFLGADELTGPAASDLRGNSVGISDDGSGNSAHNGVSSGNSRLSGMTLPSLQPQFPLLALIVSGGHSQLALFQGHGDYRLLGQTQDDAVGEAFDKVAKIIGLPYPGGPSIAAAAKLGDDQRFKFPKAKMSSKYDFSFSGLKTAVLRTVQRECGVDHTFPSHKLPELVSEALKNDIAASFQRVAVETLVDATKAAYEAYSPASVVIAGGVAANQALRQRLQERLPLPIEYAPISLCTDNAAMIATLAYYMAQSVEPTDPLSLEVTPSLSMTETAWA